VVTDPHRDALARHCREDWRARTGGPTPTLAVGARRARDEVARFDEVVAVERDVTAINAVPPGVPIDPMRPAEMRLDPRRGSRKTGVAGETARAAHVDEQRARLYPHRATRVVDRDSVDRELAAVPRAEEPWRQRRRRVRAGLSHDHGVT